MQYQKAQMIDKPTFRVERSKHRDGDDNHLLGSKRTASQAGSDMSNRPKLDGSLGHQLSGA